MSAPNAGAPRLASLDAFRGAVMVFLATDGFGLRALAREGRGGAVRAVLDQVHHVPWRGLTAWDLIQPAFLFMVGLAMPFAAASRARAGETPAAAWRHAARRAVLLVLLGVALPCLSGPSARREIAFDHVLAQMGLGYMFVFAALRAGPRWRVALALMAFAGPWLVLRFWADPSASSPYAMHTNAFAAFDRVLLNAFPREAPHVYAEGGYQTLSFVSSMLNTMGGVWAAERLRGEDSGAAKLAWLRRGAVVLVLLGFALDASGLCPAVKRIWTPSFAVLSLGFSLALLAAVFWWVDMRGQARPEGITPAAAANSPRGVTHALRVVGMNSLAVYLLIELVRPWLLAGVLWLAPSPPAVALWGVRLCSGVLVLLPAFWMYRRRVFLRL